ncbi:hypothetical protein ACLKA6_019567 [Drosophila palustris]
MDLLRCCLLLLLAFVATVLATPTLKDNAVFMQKKSELLEKPTQLLSALTSKFSKPKPVFIKPVVVKPIVVVKPFAAKKVAALEYNPLFGK